VEAQKHVSNAGKLVIGLMHVHRKAILVGAHEAGDLSEEPANRAVGGAIRGRAHEAAQEVAGQSQNGAARRDQLLMQWTTSNAISIFIFLAD
jgi:hypothetical protein